MPKLTFVFKCEIEVHINPISCCAELEFIGFTAASCKLFRAKIEFGASPSFISSCPASPCHLEFHIQADEQLIGACQALNLDFV